MTQGQQENVNRENIDRENTKMDASSTARVCNETLGVRRSRPWNAFATVALGKSVRALSRVLKHGGSALPGKVVERVDPGFLARMLSSVPGGVVLVSGTNGKTTTTRMIASIFEDLGLKVFTNPTGSNFTRGVVSSLLESATISGKLDSDIAVLELDEAYAVHFVEQVEPQYCVLLNVMRDQLDRFGEIDNTAQLLGRVVEATTGTVVLNREDARIAGLANGKLPGADVKYFGLAQGLRSRFPSDDDMHGEPSSESALQRSADKYRPDSHPADVTLTEVEEHKAQFSISGVQYGTEVKLEGVYNLFNAAAALTVVRAVLERLRSQGDQGTAEMRAKLVGVDDARLMQSLSQVTPAFGRGEIIEVSGTPVELLLVKNPMGFRLSLESFNPSGHQTMIAICDEYADGRDMSWLWDVDFRSLRTTGVAMVSGTRAYDMELRLQYDRVSVEETDTDLESAIERFVTNSSGLPKRVYCTYTSMLRVRARLAHLAEVSDAGVGRQ